jgi:aerobic carbon-monoxide dehydrogenase large subunit
MDFLMPYVSEVPRQIEIDHLETPSPLNPLGVKGAGEAGVIPGAAVLAAAIEDAEGIPVRRMPLSPSDLYELRQARQQVTGRGADSQPGQEAGSFPDGPANAG